LVCLSIGHITGTDRLREDGLSAEPTAVPGIRPARTMFAGLFGELVFLRLNRASRL